MSLESARYRTTVLFGKEHRQRVVEPDRFAAIVKTLADTVAPAHGQLRVRGRIDGPRAKNVAPRPGAWTRASLSRWQTSLAAGRFRTLELFGPQWSSHEVPLVYASLRKFWGYGPGGHTERTLHGAENNITVAVAHAVSQEQGEWVDECVRTLGTLIDAFYGFAEESVRWGKPFAPGSQSYTYTIDMRAHDIAEGAYRGGKYSMDEYVSGVYWGNLFSESHIRGKPSAVLGEQTGTTFQVGEGATFLRFRRDPEHDDQLRGEAESLFRLVPKTKVPPPRPLDDRAQSEMKHTVKYDDASWHHEGDFPSDLPDDAAGTHIGMFLAWAVEAGLLSQQLAEEGAADVAAVRARQMTGRELLYRALDGKLIDEDLSDVGNTFARTYYGPDDAPYLLDYHDTLADGLPSIYHAADTWENFERLRPVLDRRFGDWLRDHRSGD